MTDDISEKITETWTCAGVRIGSNDKRIMAWVRPSGDTVQLIERRSSYVIGGRYNFTVTMDDDGKLTGIWGPQEYAGTREDDKTLLAEWRAREAAAEARLAAADAERRHKGEDPLDALLDPLIAVAVKLRTGADRDAFLAHVTRRIAVAAWGRRS